MKTYVIKNKRNGLFKIGRSQNPIIRLSQIEQIKGDCELLIVIDRDCESLLHNVFYKSHIGGEWFLLTETDLQSIIDYKNGKYHFSTPFYLLDVRFEIIKGSNLVELKPLNRITLSMWHRPINLPQLLSTSEIKQYIETIKTPHNCIVSNVGTTKSTWVNILLFIEIARSIHPKIKIAIYEMLTGAILTDVRQIVRLAVDEAKELKK